MLPWFLAFRMGKSNSVVGARVGFGRTEALCLNGLMTGKKLAVWGIGLVISYFAIDYYFAIPGPSRTVIIDKKVVAKRDLFPANDDIVVPSFLQILLPNSNQAYCHESAHGIERGKIPITPAQSETIQAGQKYVLKFNLGRLSNLVYDAHFEGAPIESPRSEFSGYSSAPSNVVPSSPSQGGVPTIAPSPDSDFAQVLAQRYQSSDPTARLNALLSRERAMAASPGSYRTDVTTGSDALDNRIGAIRSAHFVSLNPIQREIFLEITQVILDASDPSLPAGPMPADKVAEINQLIACWDQPIASPVATSTAQGPQAASDRLHELAPRLHRQLERQFVPFVQWDAVAAQADAREALGQISYDTVTDRDVDRLARDTKRMERAK